MFSHPGDQESTWTLNWWKEVFHISPSSTQCQEPTVQNSGNGSMRIWLPAAFTEDTPPGLHHFSSKKKMTNSDPSLTISVTTLSDYISMSSAPDSETRVIPGQLRSAPAQPRVLRSAPLSDSVPPSLGPPGLLF